VSESVSKSVGNAVRTHHKHFGLYFILETLTTHIETHQTSQFVCRQLIQLQNKSVVQAYGLADNSVRSCIDKMAAGFEKNMRMRVAHYFSLLTVGKLIAVLCTMRPET
jgi:hypothetical protein